MVLRRFWKLITLLAVIIAVLVTYFVHTSIVIANQFPELEIKTISGDESLMKNVTINGDYHRIDNYYSPLIVSLDGATYYEQLSYFEKLGTHFPPNEAAKLSDKYRNFMRGRKMPNPASFHEDDNYLAYVNAEVSDWNYTNLPHSYLEVDVLNKETRKSHAFQVKLPGVGEAYVDVLNVQMINEQLNVVVNLNYRLNNRFVDEVKVFTIDISSEKVIGDQTLFDPKVQNNKDNWNHIQFLSNQRKIDAGNNMLLQKDTNRDGEVIETDEYSEEVSIELLDRKFFVYNLKKNQLLELLLTEEQHNELLSKDLRIDGFVNDDRAYITYLDEDNLVTLTFNIDNMKVETNQLFNLKELGIENYSLRIKDDKVYVIEFVQEVQGTAKLFVGDVLTGEILYEGEIVVKDERDKNEDFFLQFYTIDIN